MKHRCRCINAYRYPKVRPSEHMGVPRAGTVMHRHTRDIAGVRRSAGASDSLFT